MKALTKAFLSRPELAALGVMIILGAIFFANQPVFMSSGNWRVMLGIIPEIGFLALGVTVLMISGEFDLSVGSVFAFGGMCPMAEGRCLLSSYVTGKSPNSTGVCSPASHVRYLERGGELVSRLGDFTINIFQDSDAAGYPTLCKGRFVAGDRASYLFEAPTSLNVIPLLPELMAAGVSALKIEGRQRGRAYTGQVVAAFRRAVDACRRGEPMPETAELEEVTEGRSETSGAYRREWR